MATSVVDILLKITARTDELQRAADEARKLSATQKEATDAARAASEQQRSAAQEAIDVQMRRRELLVSGLQFERSQLQFAQDKTGVVRATVELLERERAIQAEISALKLKSVSGGTEAERLRVQQEIQRAEQAGLRESARLGDEVRRRQAEQMAKEIADRRRLQQEVLRQYDERRAAEKSGGLFGGLSFGQFAGFVAGVTGVSLSLQGLFSIVRTGVTNALQLGETFKNTADRLQDTSENVQVVDFAFRRGGKSIADAEQVLNSLNRRLDEADAGSTPTADKFFKLGLSLEELKKATPVERLAIFGRALNRTEGDAGALDAAVEILGNKSQRTFDVLKKFGATGLKQAADDMRDAGQFLGDELTGRLAIANQIIQDLKREATIGFAGFGASAMDLSASLTGTQKQSNTANIRITEAAIRDVTAALKSLREEDALDTGEGFFNKRFTRYFRSNEIETATADLARLNSELRGLRETEKSLDAVLRATANAATLRKLNPERPSGFGTTQSEAQVDNQRVIAAERANVWLKNNAEQITKQNEELRRGLLTEEQRLAILKEELRTRTAATATGLTGAGSEGERRQITLEGENARLKALAEISRLEDSIAAAQKRAADEQKRRIEEYRREAEKAAAAEQESINNQVRAREIAVDQISFERNQLEQRDNLPATEKQARLNDLLEQHLQLLEEIYNLRAGQLANATEQERLALEAELQTLSQQQAVLLEANAPGSSDFLHQVQLADSLRTGIEGVSQALAESAIAGENLGESLSNVFRQVAVDVGAAALKTLAFRAIMSAMPGFGNFIGLSAAGFAGGGFTGAGGRNQVAGVVHRGEYVVPADAVSRTGPGAWASMVHSVRGFADGGFVGHAAALRFRDPSARTFSAGALSDSGTGSRGTASPVVFNYTFEAGVTPQQLSNLLPQLERASVRAARDAMRRNEL